MVPQAAPLLLVAAAEPFSSPPGTLRVQVASKLLVATGFRAQVQEVVAVWQCTTRRQSSGLVTWMPGEAPAAMAMVEQELSI